MQQTINEARANKQCTINIFLYVRLISFIIRLFGGFIRWPSLLPFTHSKETKSAKDCKSFNSMVPYFLLHLTSRVFESCERETLKDVDKK